MPRLRYLEARIVPREASGVSRGIVVPSPELLL